MSLKKGSVGGDPESPANVKVDSPNVSNSLVGKVLKHAVNAIAEEDESYAKMQGVYNNRYPRKAASLSPKPPRKKKQANSKPRRRLNSSSPRHSKNIRGALAPSTYVHVPRKSPSQLRRNKRNRRMNAKVIETSIISTMNMAPVVLEKKADPGQGEEEKSVAEGDVLQASPSPESKAAASPAARDGGDMLRFRGFLRGISAIKRKAKAIQAKTFHAKPALLLTGTGCLSLSPEGGRAGKWNLKNELTVDMWLFIPRTETLFAETSANVRKHTGIKTDEEGNFVKWLCCGRKDPDIFGWCPAWQGDMTKSVIQTGDGAGSSDFTAAKQRKINQKERESQNAMRVEKKEQTNISTDKRLKEGIFAPRRTNPTLLVSQEGRFKIHDTGGYCLEKDKMYGFSVVASDGTETCLTNFSIPVDRWVAFSAVYNGFYLYAYVDGQEVAAVRRHVDTVQGQLHHSDAPVIVGGDFTGMISHIRLWNIARSNEEINAGIRHRVSVKEVHSCGLPGHVSSSANASEVFVPNELTGKTATHLLADIPFYDVSLYHGDHISDQSIFGHNAHLHCDHFGWRINPPMFFGAPRPYTDMHHLVLDPEAGHQFSTISHNKIASNWQWRPLSSLTEHMRGWGKIRIVVRWDKGAKFRSPPIAFVYKLLYKLSKQDFPQDWILDVRKSIPGRPTAGYALECRSDDPDYSFFLAMTHMDQNNQYRERVLFTSRSSKFEFPDCVSIMTKLEAQIRLFTTFWHTDVFGEVKLQLRSRLAATKDEAADSTRSLKSMIETYLEQNKLQKTLEVMQGGLAPSIKRQTFQNGMSEKPLNQTLFNQIIWILGVDMQLPQLCMLGITLENRNMHARARSEDQERDKQVAEQLAIQKLLKSSSVATMASQSPAETNKLGQAKANGKSGTFPLNPSKFPKVQHVGPGSTIPLYGGKMSSAEQRQISFSLAFSWRIKLNAGQGAAALAAIVNLDLACIALDIGGVPLDSVQRYQNHTQDHAVVAHGRQRDMRAAIHETEISKGRWVSIAQTFDLDLNVASHAVNSFVFFMFGSYLDACSQLGICTVRIQRHQHDANVVNMLVREGKRRGHPIANTMAITTHTNDIATYSVDVAGNHAGLILCTMDRVENGEWVLKTLHMPFPRALHIVEQVGNMWPMLRQHTVARRPCITIRYCCDCENHQETTWHVPGAFERLYYDVAAAIKTAYPGMLINGTPSSRRIGAFKITFQRFKGASSQVLYSALDGNQGWLPTPELAAKLVVEAMESSDEENVDHEWPYNHDADARCRMKIKVYDGYYKMPIPGVAVSVHSVDSRAELNRSLAQVKEEKGKRMTNVHEMRMKRRSTMVATTDSIHTTKKRRKSSGSVTRDSRASSELNHTHTLLFTNDEGITETTLNATDTYVCQFNAPGFYPRAHPPLRVGVAADEAVKKKRGLFVKSDNAREMSIFLMPKIQTVTVALVDFESGDAVRAAGILVSLTNMQSGFKHVSETDSNGCASFNVPGGRYEENVELPEWTQVQYSLSSDSEAMRFLETARSFDLARREVVDMHRRGVVVYGESFDRIKIPGIRWPYHFTVYDSSTAAPMGGAIIQIRNRATGELVMNTVTSELGTSYQMIPVGPPLSVCITATVNGTSYFSYQKHLPRITEFLSPSLHNAFMCPIPPPGYGRAILSWTYPLRQKIDLFTEYREYCDDGDTYSKDDLTTVWANHKVSELAELDVPGSRQGLAPVSVLVKLDPQKEFRFHARQYGTFDPILCQGTEVKPLELTDTEFRFYDEHGLVTTQLAKERLHPNAEIDEKCYIWSDMFIVRVDQSNILSLDENEFAQDDANTTSLAEQEQLRASQNTSNVDERGEMARHSALELFRLIDPTLESESISCKTFVRAIMLQRSVQDFIASRPELVSLTSIHRASKSTLMSLDTDGDDSISVDELLAFASQLTLQRIKDLFELIDPNNGGEIQMTDFLLLAQTSEKVIKFFLDTPSLATLANPSTYINDLMELDVDNDGSISIDEMYDFMCRRALGIGSSVGKRADSDDHGAMQMVFLEEMDTRQYIRSMFDQFKPGHSDVVTATTFVRAIEINVRVRKMLEGRHYLKPLLFADDLPTLCKEIDRDGDGMITIDEVLYFARTLGEKQKEEEQRALVAAQLEIENAERERKSRVEKEKKAAVERERQAKLQREREAELQKEREAKLQQEREAKLQQEREAKLQQEREAKAQQERAAQPVTDSDGKEHLDFERKNNEAEDDIKRLEKELKDDETSGSF